MSEIQLVYRFLADYPQTGGITQDDNDSAGNPSYAVWCNSEDAVLGDAKHFWVNGATIGDAIRKLYEMQEKAE